MVLNHSAAPDKLWIHTQLIIFSEPTEGLPLLWHPKVENQGRLKLRPIGQSFGLVMLKVI